jgi:uncharacterized protein YlxP (DUF503 family)
LPPAGSGGYASFAAAGDIRSRDPVSFQRDFALGAAARASEMVIGLLTLDLHFPGARSLKDKRQALRSLETRIRNRFNVSVAEVEHQDLWQRARVAVVGVNTDHVHLEATLRSVAGAAEFSRDIQLLDAQTEYL